MPNAVRTVVVLGVLGLLAAPALGLEVVEVRWGFDGTVRAGAFNPLAVRLANVGRERFAGELSVERRDFAGRQGGVYRAECFLEPGQARWVRFYPMVLDSGTAWVLDLGGGQVADLGEPKLAAPAWVVMVAGRDRAGGGRSTAGLAAFPDELFPPVAAATDALGVLVLDHVPELAAAQRQALVDWVAMGGVLHLIPDAAGDLPVLEAELAPLAGSLENQPYGAGQVVRHPGAAWPVARSALMERTGPRPTMPKERNYGRRVPTAAYRGLERFSRPEHSWTAIYALAVLYFVLIGPGCALLSRRIRSHLVLNAATVGLVVVFGLVFGEVGRRGYGERESVHSASFARSLGGERYDVVQYGSLFVTSSDRYEIGFDAPFALYDPGVDDEAPSASVVSGPAGAMSTVLPLYSSRGYAFRGTLAGPTLEPVVETWRTNEEGALLELGIRLARAPSDDGAPLECLCSHRGVFHQMRLDGTAVSLTGSRATVTPDEVQRLTGSVFAGTSDSFNADGLWRALAHLLIADASGVGVGLSNRLDVPALPPDQVELYLVVRAPGGFLPRPTAARTQAGVTVLAFRLRRPHQ